MTTKTGYAVADLTALKAIDNTVRVNGYLRSVTSLRTWFMFIDSATDTPDDVNIIQPTSGTGRWFRVKAVTIPTDIPGIDEYIQDVIGASFLQSTDFSVSYDDSGNKIVINLNTGAITDTHVASTANIQQSKILNLVTTLAGKASVNHDHVVAQISDFAEGVEDVLGSGFLTSSDGSVVITYNDSTNTLNLQAVAAATNVAIYDEGVSQGNASSFNFVGSSVSASVSGGTATITLTSPSTVSSQTITVTSSSLASNASETDSFTAFPIGSFIKLQTDYPARIRIYSTSAYAAADASRPVTTELTGEHGCFLECVTISSNLILDLSPPANYYTTVSGNLLYMIITNNDSVSRAITTTLTTLKW